MAIQARRDVFQAIADPTRRAIINMVAHESLNLNAIADNFEMSRPAISQHIKILTECGLIIMKQKGRERYCEVHLEQLAEVQEWLRPLHELGEHRYDKLDNILAQMQKNKKPKK